MKLGKKYNKIITLNMCDFKNKILNVVTKHDIYFDYYMLIRHNVEIETNSIVRIINQNIKL